MQGDPLAMVAYGIEILLLIKHLKSTYLDVTQPWYADHAGALGMFDHLDNYFKALKRKVPERGYFSDPTKKIIVVHPQNPESGEEFRRRHGFRVCTSACCIWGYIRDDKNKCYWLKNCKDKWEREIRALRKRSISILWRVMPRWTVWFNRIGSFINV